MNHVSDIVINQLEFDHLGKIIEKVNLNGIHILATSLTWAPFVTLWNCNEFGLNCSSEGKECESSANCYIPYRRDIYTSP